MYESRPLLRSEFVPPASIYFLQTPRLGFRCWSTEDFPLAVSLWSDVRATRFIGGPFSEEQIQERLSGEMNSMNAQHVQYWPIFWLENGDFAGCCGLRPYKDEERIYELGFHLRPAHWGRGLALEGAKAVMAYAFDELKAEKLFAGHHPENSASRRVLEKLGFQFTHEELYAPTGRLHRCYLLSRPE
jgi:[ribosomal protein S5]-alanine N-acetyltransferase